MDIITQKDAELLSDFINKHSFFFIIGHKEPDGDCISSCLGVKAILDHFKKDYQMLSAGPFKRNEIKKYENLFSNEMIFQDNEERNRSGLIIVDCSEISRLGEIDGDLKNLDTFVIDHHKTSGLPEKALGYINPQSPACAFLIQQYYEQLIGPVPEETAKVIFFGLCTDTGFFRFLTKDSAPVFEASARLVNYGADPRETYNTINSGKPFSTRKLLGILLSRTELYLDGRLAITYETLEDTKKWGVNGRDSDALYQLLLSSDKIEAVAFLRQDTITTCTGGLRSLDKVDVSKVASKFGGGGHKNASGLSTEGKLETLIPQIIKEFARII